MIRLKFLLFAIPVIGLLTAHLYLSSPLMGERAMAEARARVGGAPPAVAEVVLQRRVELQRLALKATGSAPALAFAQGGRAAPAPDKLTALMDVLKDAAPEALRPGLIVGVLNESGSLYARGDAEPTSDESALDLKAVAEAGTDGMAQDAFGQTYLFYALPIAIPAGAEPRVAARMILGAPLVDSTLADAVARDTGLTALALVQGGKVLQSGGSDKGALDRAVKEMRPGALEVLQRGSVATAGPFKLPMLTQKDVRGGMAPLLLAAREAIPTTPYEVISVASLAPAMTALAAYQRNALVGLGALVFLTLAWTLLMGSGKSEDGDEETDEDADGRASRTDAANEGRVPPLPLEPRLSPGALPMQDAPPAPEASPDDFPFGGPLEAPGARRSDMRTQPGVVSPFMPPPEPAEHAPDAPTPFPSQQPIPAGPLGPLSDNPFDFENQPTRAYTVPPPGASVLSAPPVAPAPMNGASGGGAEDFNPDATRVTAIPDELLRASARPSKPEMPAVVLPKPVAAAAPPRVGAVSAPPVPPLNEEQHFQDVYKEFIATRERCGEAADGLTFEKFVSKLKKNKEQLIQKYSCRTVRFQVYVKEGKAALKATPVKD
jgi:hypothetical protein